LLDVVAVAVIVAGHVDVAAPYVSPPALSFDPLSFVLGVLSPVNGQCRWDNMIRLEDM
jgi:hypothetical protein